MQSSILRKSVVVIISLALAFGLLVLPGCSSNSTSTGGASESGASTAESGASASEEVNGAREVTLTIDISAAVAEQDPTALELEKTQGTLFTQQIKIPEDATVMDVLEASGVDIVTTASSFGDYVSGINGLASGSVGPESGWTFFINGEFSLDAAGVATLKAGDTVLWQFVTSYE